MGPKVLVSHPPPTKRYENKSLECQIAPLKEWKDFFVNIAIQILWLGFMGLDGDDESISQWSFDASRWFQRQDLLYSPTHCTEDQGGDDEDVLELKLTTAPYGIFGFIYSLDSLTIAEKEFEMHLE